MPSFGILEDKKLTLSNVIVESAKYAPKDNLNLDVLLLKVIFYYQSKFQK